MSKKLLNILSIALIYCGAVFGAGFASGREIFSFFSCYKTGGIIASVFAGFLFSFFGCVVCKYANKMNMLNGEQYFAEIFPKGIAKFFRILANAFLVLSFCIMITGCGALFYEQFGIDHTFGSVASLVICFAVIKKDVKGLSAFNLIATPVMLAGVIGLCFMCMRLPPVSEVVPDEKIAPCVSALLYVSYNMVSGVAVLVAGARLADNPRQAAWGGALGGILIGIPLVLMSAVLACHWEVASLDLPFFGLIYSNFPKLSIVCWVVLYFAMMTTAVSSGVAVLSDVSGQKNSKTAFLLCILALFMSFVPFKTLIQTVYSAFGFIGIVLITAIFIKILRKSK